MHWCKKLLETAVDCSDRLGGALALAPADVVASKEKLAGQVALFDMIVVCDDKFATFATSHAHHGKVLEEFTAKGPSTDQKHFQSP